MESTEQLYQRMLEPSADLVGDIGRIEGDIMILGAGGKMGPALATLAAAAIREAGIKKNILAISRFSDKGARGQLESNGIQVIAADLLNDAELQSLPPVKNILYLAGTKFGTQGNEALTWAMNSYLPGRVAQQFPESNIVAFSTGNVYHLTPVHGGGSTEDSPTNPVGEYAQSCLGRERLFQYYSSKLNTPVLIYRLNYANDVSYGVLLEIARSVRSGKPVDLRMGNVNVIWQGDANEIAIRALLHCQSPAKILNVTGPETVSVRWAAEEFGRMMNMSPQFSGEEQPTSLLSNAAECFRLFGYPRTTLKQMMEILVSWLDEGKKTLDKDTHFQERQGQF